MQCTPTGHGEGGGVYGPFAPAVSGSSSVGDGEATGAGDGDGACAGDVADAATLGEADMVGDGVVAVWMTGAGWQPAPTSVNSPTAGSNLSMRCTIPPVAFIGGQHSDLPVSGEQREGHARRVMIQFGMGMHSA